MPVFICEGCNETLKRNKVAQHQWSCKRCWVLSCMDCNRRFEGEDYLLHQESPPGPGLVPAQGVLYLALREVDVLNQRGKRA